ncbi:malto-oligosyltrehalose synthase [Pseudomonas matsuisoli]|uniref:Malto-oligosyltrehalose synthase n=1 Tax=Pseudomonas matsuisoli TaxID=1515666 RepID=A0A917PNQ6_9PSED|nr:malto-oligosyltrehalose synthase [Pseudomonas matsuisoli]GGJ86246.1 malto-oligosyltrehalose synthase [Pseudomonas matsuisoli]
MSPLCATQRLQFHKDFTLDDATALVDYFADLGITHLYASPLLVARAGSMHGYDVVDPTRINPELGGEPALRRLVEALRKRNMGLILDIVSNHMAVGGDSNPWWLDVLEWGRRSPYANFFDIQWHSPDPLLEGQLLVPFLGTDYGQALKDGLVPLQFDAESGAFYAQHYEHRFPINPQSYAELLGSTDHPELREMAARFAALRGDPDAWQTAQGLRNALADCVKTADALAAIESMLPRYDATTGEGFTRLHALLERQSYRLASWRTAADDINWRRFFDINELGGLRVERSDVFEATHAKIFQLVEEGLIDGLRIDHVDGLADPRGYCRRLRRRVDSLLATRPQDAQLPHFPIYVEKILAEGEHLQNDWGVDGTTGYEFMNQVSLLQHDPAGETTMKALWARISGRTDDFMEEVREARALVLTNSLAGDFETVAQALLQVARSDVMTRDITLGAIRRALLELIIHFPVYRTYVSACGRTAADEPFFQQALEGAKQNLPEGEWHLLDQIAEWLGGTPIRTLPREQRALRRYACTRFQQLTSPAAAKAVEDTACYRSAVALARNDVGFDPQQFAGSIELFHEQNAERAKHFPLNMLTTATHDHKRGEDTRARLAVLSERAEWFAEQVEHWMTLAEPFRDDQGERTAPSPGDELLIYQALLGCWSIDGREDRETFKSRVLQWQEKAMREAKLFSTWSNPDEPYEKGARAFVEGLLGSTAFTDSMDATVNAIAPAGALNSLVQTTLRMTVPGVPDLYQGTEYWDFSLVDPDNRRPVDYAARQTSLLARPPLSELIARWPDGHMKQRLIDDVLHARFAHAALFHNGDYLPLATGGTHADRIVAFARVSGDDCAIVVLPRLAAALLEGQSTPLIPAERWADTFVELPEAYKSRRYVGLFSSAGVTPNQGRLSVREVLAEFPVNVFYLESN